MKIDDIKNVLRLAKAEHETVEQTPVSVHEANGKSIEAVEAWLRSVGAITATVKGAKVLDARSRAAGNAGTKRRQRS
jgi:hypothetical protein